MIQRWELAKPWTEVLGMPLHAVVLAAGLGKTDEIRAPQDGASGLRQNR